MNLEVLFPYLVYIFKHFWLGEAILNILVFTNAMPFIDLGETWFLGILTGLVCIFLLLAILSKIRPYILCGFWFIALMMLYIWRSGYIFLLMPSLSQSPNAGIYIFVLQSIPLIIFLITTKVISVLQAREFVFFTKVFSASVWISITYLGLIVLSSFINAPFVVANLKIIQSVFWVILVAYGLFFLFWLFFSSKKNFEFIQFQSTFGLLFLISVGGKIYTNMTNSPSAYLKPKYILWGIAAQLIYIYWLLLKEIFKDWNKESIENNLNFETEDSNNQTLVEPLNTNELLNNLSPRELDIFLAYCNGFSYTDISSSYFISPNTVKSHLKSCYRKLNINSKVEAISIVNEFNQTEKQT
ncbi:regulatory protein, luxR family [Spirosomataceae bacterium TFI 002]|nr:regulatory protein, luxR family [Spirosomataceae bacterium TFI 002]